MLRRRVPRTLLPRVVVPLATAALLLTVWGLGWAWEWSLQTGNVFLLLLIPKRGVPLLRLPALAAGLACAYLALRFGMRRPAPLESVTLSSTRWIEAWPVRFFPLVFLLGLFLLIFGILFAFDATIAADRAPGGFALFLYLDYAGLLHRPSATVLGLLLAGVGSRLLTRGAFASLRPRTSDASLERLRAPISSAKKDLQ